MLRSNATNRQKSMDDASARASGAAGWMSRSQSLAMSLMDSDHLVSEKRASMLDAEDTDLATCTRTVYRLVDRENKFQQAKYPISVQRILPLEEVFNLFYAKDPVLALTNLSTPKGFFVMLMFFVLSCAITAVPWYIMGQYESYREECSVETTGFQRAFIFSSQVIMTIGFGTKDIFFGDCVTPTIVLTVHCGVSLLVQSFIMGIIYQRLSRATSRRHTVVFSNNAVIRRIRGKLYFMLQVSELRATQLVETHVRLYMVRHESIGAQSGGSPGGPQQVPSEEDVLCTQTCAMRLSHPNDDLGSKLLLSTPQVIVHEIDEHSPLRPPAEWSEEPRGTCSLPPRPSSLAFGGVLHATSSDTGADGPGTGRRMSFNPLSLSRSLSSSSGDNVSVRGARDGDKTKSGKKKTVHVNDGSIFSANDYQFPDVIRNKSRVSEKVDEEEIEVGNKMEKESHFELEKDFIQRYLHAKNAEIVVVLEGVDPMTSHNVQSHHSYVSEEIKWDHFFAQCCSVVNGWTTVDFTKFHHLKKVAADEINANHAPSFN